MLDTPYNRAGRLWVINDRSSILWLLLCHRTTRRDVPPGDLSAGGRRLPGLHRIAGAVEFAKVGQPAHGEAMGILLARLEQRGDIFRHFGARLGAGGGGVGLRAWRSKNCD